MKNNRSLAISTIINEKLMNESTLSFMSEYIPNEIFEKEITKTRDRIYTQKSTIETMLLISTLEDKSLKNSVAQYYVIHQRKRAILEQELKHQSEIQKKAERSKATLRGRPKKHEIKLPKSKTTDISLNTAGYSKARKRLPLELTASLFESSKIVDAKNNYSHWHNLKVLNADGTYLQLQDTQEIRNKYPIKNNNGGGYPQALFVYINQKSTSSINRKVSSFEQQKYN